jgi:hypothetical protein
MQQLELIQRALERYKSTDDLDEQIKCLKIIQSSAEFMIQHVVDKQIQQANEQPYKDPGHYLGLDNR